MKSLALCLVLMAACAPTTRLVTRKCPTPVTSVLMDFFLGAAAMGIGALKLRVDKTTEGYLYSGLGVHLVGGAYLTELSCSK